MDNQSIFDILNLSFFTRPSSYTYYTCEIKSKTWVCQKGSVGDHVFRVPNDKPTHQYLKKVLAFDIILK
jgi:hypothetical protein